jgi:hypothetical protein
MNGKKMSRCFYVWRSAHLPFPGNGDRELLIGHIKYPLAGHEEHENRYLVLIGNIEIGCYGDIRNVDAGDIGRYQMWFKILLRHIIPSLSCLPLKGRNPVFSLSFRAGLDTHLTQGVRGLNA